MQIGKTRATSRIILLVVLALLAYLPFSPLKFKLTYFLLMFMWIILSESFNIISGYTGYVCFGYPAFIGFGAFFMVMPVMYLGLSPYLSLWVGVAMAALLATGVGVPTLKLRGAYFSIATLAICLALEAIFADIYPKGVYLPPIPAGLQTYYGMFFAAVGTVVLTYMISRSKFGLGLVAIREDEDAAEVRGIDTFKYKMTAFVISAVPVSLAGGLYAWYATYIEAYGIFSLEYVVMLIAMCMLGGAGTVWGPIIGAIILHTMSDFLWASFPFIHLIVLGALIIIVVLFIPRGIVGELWERAPRTKRFLP